MKRHQFIVPEDSLRAFNHVALLLKSKRVAHPKRYSQSELSHVLGYKNGQFISNIERGLCSIPLKSLTQVIDLLNIDRQELMRAMMNDFESTIEHYLENSKDAKPNSKSQRSSHKS